MSERIFGFSWDTIQRAQPRAGRLADRVDLSRPGDYGADPIGDGTFRMVPSGDVVDLAERNRRLAR